MTIGEKIKYFRTKKGITQGTLAELADVHPVSIRKYETNKMQPQPAQIERIAAALGVSYNALIGIDNNGLRLETVGDLMGILMILCNSKILEIKGERLEDDLLDTDTVTIQFSSVLADYLEILYLGEGEQSKLSLGQAIINIKGTRMFEDLLKWEKMNYMYRKSHDKYKDDQSEAVQTALADLLQTKELIELELQRSNILLDTSDGIKVNTMPDYNPQM